MKRIIGLMLAVFMVFSSIPFLACAEEGDHTRYTVLVLDTSGKQSFYQGNTLIYTADSAVSYVKRASNKFVQDVLSSGDNNRIAVVQYNDSAAVVSGFSDNSVQIESKINSLSSGDSECCIASGLEKAEQLLNQVADANADKNIVLVTTGFTNSGQSNYSGHYDENTIGSNWYNRVTSIKLYAYANVAYSTAERVKKNATIYTLGLFQTMNGMPESGKNIASFFKLTAKDLASTEDHFYEVDDPSKLEIVFGDITEKLINPLGITLSHILIDETVSKKMDDVTTEYTDHYLYRITAQVSNTADTTAKNVICTFELPPEAVPFNQMISPASKKEISLGDISVGETKSVSWNLEIKWPEKDIAPIYEVHAKADNTVDMYQANVIHVPAQIKNNNSLIFGTDQWSFSNSYNFFDPKANETYYMSNSDYDALVYKLSNVEINDIDSFCKSSWGGSCYGFSTTVALTKMGVFKASEIQSGRNNLYEVKKNSNNDSVESFINYHQMTWFLNPVQRVCDNFSLRSDNDQIQTIANMADRVAKGGSPIVICFQWPVAGGAHAVVAYGRETGSWRFGGTLGFGGNTYDSRILIYDCNYPDDKDGSCIYYNNGSGDVYIPNYAHEKDDPDIYFACDSVEVLDSKNFKVNTTNQKAALNAENITSYAIIIDNVKYNVSPKANNKSKGIYSYYLPFETNGKNSTSKIKTILPDLKEDYYIVLGDDKSGKLSLNYENLSVGADVKSAKKIGFKANGGVSLEENNGQFELSLVANDGHYTTPWYKTTISGDKSNNIEMKQTKEGVKVDGDNLSNIKITTKDDNGEKVQVITTDKDSVLLTSDKKDNPIVMVDSDGDGKYDKQLHTYVLSIKATKGGKIIGNPGGRMSRNTIIEISAKADKGYVFSGWTSSNGGTFEDAKSMNTKFTMSSNDTVVEAKFRKKTLIDNALLHIKSIPDRIIDWLKNLISKISEFFGGFFDK